MLKNPISVTKLKHTLLKQAAMGFLYAGKPFATIDQWCWRMHKQLLDSIK